MKQFINILFLLLIVNPIWSQISVVLQTGNKDEVTELDFHPTLPYLVSSDENNTLCIWNIQQKKQYNSHQFSHVINDFCFLNDSILLVAQNSSLLYWNYTTGQIDQKIELHSKIRQLAVLSNEIVALTDQLHKLSLNGSHAKSVKLSSDVDLFSISEDEELMVTSGVKKVEVFNYKTLEVIHQFNVSALDLDISSSNKRLSVVTDRSSIQLYDLYSGQKMSEVASQRKWKPFTKVALGDNNAAVGDDDDVLQIYDLENGKLTKNIKNKTGKISSMTYQPKEGLLAAAGNKGRIHVYDLSSGKILQTYQSLSPDVKQITTSWEDATYILGYQNGQIKKWNFKSHQVETIHPESSFLDAIREPLFEVVYLESNKAVLRKYWNSQLSDDQSKEKFYTYKWDSTFNLVSVEKSEKPDQRVKGFKQHKSELIYGDVTVNLPEDKKVIGAFLNEEEELLLISLNDGFIYFHDTKTSELLIQAFSSAKNGFFYMTPEKYYFASKNALESVGARYNGVLLDFKQLDTRYNRPDKVLEQLPYFTDEYITLLKKARKKRLNKMGLSDVQEFAPEKLPKLETNFSELPLYTDEKIINVVIQSTSNYEELKALHVSINGIPQFGLNGKKMEGMHSEWKGELQLTPGLNRIEVYTETVNGFESIRKKAEVTLDKKYKPNLYVLSVGSGTFEVSDFNLKYAEKDALEFAELMQENKSFNQVFVETLTHQDVTKGNLTSSIESLKKAKREDVVIMLFAGHGLLDPKLDYYLSTYDMDFNNPSKKGIAILELEKLMAQLPSQNKILLLDACHSGELDKDEVVSITDVAKEEDADIQFRSGLKSVGLEGSQSVFELSKNIFADLRKNNGVITISSAGSDEYALEGGKWKNGAFTYAILDGLSNKKADLNGDKSVTSNELSEYLFKAVPRLTKGKQTPTSRVENLFKNIIIW